MINNIFNDESIRKLRGSIGIGHTRYSTSAASEEVNCQPFVVHTAHGALAVAHNGELVNCDSLRKMVGLIILIVLCSYLTYILITLIYVCNFSTYRKIVVLILILVTKIIQSNKSYFLIKSCITILVRKRLMNTFFL